MKIKKREFAFGTVVVVMVILVALSFGSMQRKEYIDTESQQKTLNKNIAKEEWFYNDSKAELEEGTDVWLSHAYRIIDTWKSGTLKDVQELLPVDMKLSEENLYVYMHDTWPTIPFTIKMTGNFQKENYNVMFFDVYIQEEDSYYRKKSNNLVMTIYEDGTFVPFVADYDSDWEAEKEEDIISKAWDLIN